MAIMCAEDPAPLPAAITTADGSGQAALDKVVLNIFK